MPDPTTPGWARAFRLVWKDLNQEVYGVQFSSGRVVLDDPFLLVGAPGIRLVEARGLDALKLPGLPRVRVEWAPEVTPRVTAVIEAAELHGWTRAVEALRDNVRLGSWLANRINAARYATVGPDGEPLGEWPWPPAEYPPRCEYADYLEAHAPNPANAVVDRG